MFCRMDTERVDCFVGRTQSEWIFCSDTERLKLKLKASSHILWSFNTGVHRSVNILVETTIADRSLP